MFVYQTMKKGVQTLVAYPEQLAQKKRAVSENFARFREDLNEDRFDEAEITAMSNWEKVLENWNIQTEQNLRDYIRLNWMRLCFAMAVAVIGVFVVRNPMNGILTQTAGVILLVLGGWLSIIFTWRLRVLYTRTFIPFLSWLIPWRSNG